MAPQAWMDTPRACMWLELCVAPLAAVKPVVLVWDNCGSHKTEGVKQFAASLQEGRVHLKNLIENTTDLLQPMDLVVNAPIKADLRNFRIGRATLAFDAYSTEFYLRRLARQNEGKPMTMSDVKPFTPSKLPLASGIDCVLTTLESGRLADGLKKCFVTVGLTKDDDGAYRSLRCVLGAPFCARFTEPVRCAGSTS
jgi:hypothetical protein